MNRRISMVLTLSMVVNILAYAGGLSLAEWSKKLSRLTTLRGRM